MTAQEIGYILAHINGFPNLASALCLFLGFRAIKQKNQQKHERLITWAIIFSVAFLMSYTTRMMLTGSVSFPGTGLVRSVYLGILFTHMVLAVINVPLVIRTFYLAKRSRFAEHRKLAKIAFPIWAYVSVTGVIVYVMLYHLGPQLV